MNVKILFLFLLSIKIISSDLSDICSVCECWNISNDTKIVNCYNRNLSNIPTLPLNITEKTLSLSFANNNIYRLKPIPKIDVDSFSLSLKNCSIHEINSDIFMEAPKIKYLDLSYNLLKYEDFDLNIFRGPYNNEVYEPITLTELNLAYNQLKAIEPNIFEHTPNLTYLDLSGNPLNVLSDNFYEAIGSLKFLRSLILRNTSLEGNDRKKDIKVESLKYLDVSDNNLKGLPRYFSVMFPAIEILTIDNNPIEELNDETFLGFNKLRKLNINNMPQLRSVKHHTFTNLPSLQMLHLTRNRNLVHINMLAFGDENNHPPITELYINDNNLRELNMNLLNWTQLTIFEYDGNHWMCSCNQVASVHCDCEIMERKMVFMNDFKSKEDKPTKSWSVTRIMLSIVIIILCCASGVFVWRILLKYRSYRVVNVQYPVFYSSVPTVH